VCLAHLHPQTFAACWCITVLFRSNRIRATHEIRRLKAGAFLACIYLVFEEISERNVALALSIQIKVILGRAMVQAVSRRLLTAEARVHALVSPYGICGGQSGAGTKFPPRILVFPCQYHSTVVLHTCGV
jgi:hypothetical protein